MMVFPLNGINHLNHNASIISRKHTVFKGLISISNYLYKSAFQCCFLPRNGYFFLFNYLPKILSSPLSQNNVPFSLEMSCSFTHA